MQVNGVFVTDLQDVTLCRRALDAMLLIFDVRCPAEPLVAPGLPVAVKLPDLRLIIAAGDNEQMIDTSSLKAIAAEHRCSVVALAVDPSKGWRRTIFDIAVWDRREVVQHESYRLWMSLPPNEAVFLVPEHQLHGEAFVATGGGIAPRRDPYRSLANRTAGLEVGQDRLDRHIWGGARNYLAATAGDGRS